MPDGVYPSCVVFQNFGARSCTRVQVVVGFVARVVAEVVAEEAVAGGIRFVGGVHGIAAVVGRLARSFHAF